MEKVIRVKYCKEGPIKYISHLSLAQVFTRALRRANIPVLISSGYNPRLRISFGPPLALGIGSTGEYFDIRITEEMTTQELVKRLNSALPTGLKIMKAMTISSSLDSLVKTINSAIYLVTLKWDYQFEVQWEKINKDIEEYLELKEIWISKAGKNGFKRLNIRPSILDFKIEEKDIENRQLFLEINVKMGNDGNLNPNYVIKAWLTKNEYSFEIVDLNRIGMYINNREVM